MNPPRDRGEGKRVLLDYGAGKYHIYSGHGGELERPYPIALCGYSHATITPIMSDLLKAAPEDICKRCLSHPTQAKEPPNAES